MTLRPDWEVPQGRAKRADPPRRRAGILVTGNGALMDVSQSSPVRELPFPVARVAGDRVGLSLGHGAWGPSVGVAVDRS